MKQTESGHTIRIPYCDESLLPSQFGKQGVYTEFNLNTVSWEAFPYMPIVSLRLGWNRNWIFLFFTVQEKEIRGWETKVNGRVWEDSCVEFFIAPENEKFYYNFEFNCIGTCLLGYGNGKEGRIHASEDVIRKIYVESSLGNKRLESHTGDHLWTLQVGIPPAAFFQHSQGELKSGIVTGNFYKCGDGLKEPHFVCWKKIETMYPDFHQPDYFGRIILE